MEVFKMLYRMQTYLFNDAGPLRQDGNVLLMRCAVIPIIHPKKESKMTNKLQRLNNWMETQVTITTY